MNEYYDRYDKFRTNTGTVCLPNIRIPVLATDKPVVYRKGKTRFDRLSNEYYGNPYHGWLIMLANPEFGGLEGRIPDNTVIRIPFPFKVALGNYASEVDNYQMLYGK